MEAQGRRSYLAKHKDGLQIRESSRPPRCSSEPDDCFKPMTFPDHVTVYHKLSNEPTQKTDSFILDVLILSELHQRPAARCIEDIVVYNYRLGKKTTLPPFMADAFQRTWQLQEEAKKTNSNAVRDLLARVRALEKQSWDAPDAVEDMGSNT